MCLSKLKIAEEAVGASRTPGLSKHVCVRINKNAIVGGEIVYGISGYKYMNVRNHNATHRHGRQDTTHP